MFGRVPGEGRECRRAGVPGEGERCGFLTTETQRHGEGGGALDARGSCCAPERGCRRAMFWLIRRMPNGHSTAGQAFSRDVPDVLRPEGRNSAWRSRQ